jgi:hypothetical protein
MGHLLAYTYMKEKVKIKIIMLFTSMEEVIVEELIFLLLYKIAIKEVMENSDQPKMYNHSMGINVESCLRFLNKTPFSMIGQKSLLFIVMEHNI